jgi:diacylglycerol kinase (ATP)
MRRAGYRCQVPEPRSHLVLANEQAGSTARQNVALAVARLAEHAPARLRWTGSQEEFQRAIADADDDVQIVVAGGDGSIHLTLETVDQLGRADRPVGIIPLGTGNDFARNHHLPLDPETAADVVLQGRPTSVDAIEITHGQTREMVANNLHVGLGVDAAHRAKGLKKGLGRLSYPVATAIEGASGTCRRHRILVDGDLVWDAPLFAGLVLLGASMGGGVEMLEDSDVASVDVVAIGAMEPRERLGLVRAAMRGDISSHHRAERWSAEAVEIGAEGGVEVDADGELTTHPSPIRLRHLRGAWTVLTPSS